MRDLAMYTPMLDKVMINGKDVEAVLDTGAGVSVINYALAKKLHLDIDIVVSRLEIESFDDRDVKSEGAIIDAPIHIGARVYPDHLIVNKYTKPALLLGMSWFKRNHTYPDPD